MIGALIYIIGMGSMAITGVMYLAYIIYRTTRQVWVTRRQYEPTESMDKVEGEEWQNNT